MSWKGPHAPDEHVALRGRLFSPAFFIAAMLALVGLAIIGYRMVYGLGAVTNLSDGYPWGIWITFDVMIGSAFGCAGYAMALVVYILNRGHYHPLVRPAVMASLFGYGFAGMAVMIDLGRWWQFYNMFLPWYWNPNSVMLETALCIAAYVTVLLVEFSPAFLERLGFNRVQKHLDRLLFAVIAVGVLLPTMHQSSLGTILVIVGHKLSPLWQTPLLPVLFLASALLMGYVMVVLEGFLVATGLGRPLELPLTTPLSRIMGRVLAVFLVLRLVDLTWRGAWGHAFAGDVVAGAFWLELALMAAPLPILLAGDSVHRPQRQFLAAFLLLIGGIVFRINAYLVGYQAAIGPWSYFPSVAETLVTVGMVAFEVVLYLAFIHLLPVLPALGPEDAPAPS